MTYSSKRLTGSSHAAAASEFELHSLNTALNKSQLRRQMRARRRDLSSQQQRQAALALKQRLINTGLWSHCRHVAAYLAQDGEIDPSLGLAGFHSLYLPRLHPLKPNRLWFYRWTQDSPMQKNRFGIAEPVMSARDRRPLWSLSLVLLPLVAFDTLGRRLGMGGGFYDRSLARLGANRPLLIGLAHDCQQVDLLPVASWDIPLDAILTPSRFIVLNRRAVQR